MDNKDSKILEILKLDSRLPIRDIAKKTSLRPSTVHQRLKKLKYEKVIEKFTIKLNNKAIDESFIVFMLINTSKDLEETFFHNKHLKEAFGLTGEYDLLLKLKFKDIEEFNSFIINLRKNKSIRKTLTMIATINLKEEL